MIVFHVNDYILRKVEWFDGISLVFQLNCLVLKSLPLLILFHDHAAEGIGEATHETNAAWVFVIFLVVTSFGDV